MEKTRKYSFITIFSFFCFVILFLSSTQGFSQDIIAVEKSDDKWIYVYKSTGKQAFPGEWKWALDFYEGNALVSCFNGSMGLLNEKGEMVLPCEYDNIGELHDGLRAISREYKVGFCDVNGTIVIPLTFRNDSQILSEFSEGLACVMQNDNYIFIDKQGKKAINIEFGFWGGAAVYYLPRFKEGLSVAHKKYKFGFIDKKGKWIIKPQYDAADEFSEGLAAVRKGKKVFYIDKTGKRAFKRNLGCVDEGCCGFIYGKFINGQAEVNISTRMLGKSKQDQYCEEIRAIIDRQGNIIKILEE